MSLNEKRVLVVEDDGLLAMELDMVLGEAGVAVVGPMRGVAESLALLDKEAVDAAVLDVNLHCESSEGIADRLAADGIPFLYLSGHAEDALPAQHRHRPLVTKPFRDTELLNRLRDVLDTGVDGAA